jgi:hypothetical protein
VSTPTRKRSDESGDEAAEPEKTSQGEYVHVLTADLPRIFTPVASTPGEIIRRSAPRSRLPGAAYTVSTILERGTIATK